MIPELIVQDHHRQKQHPNHHQISFWCKHWIPFSGRFVDPSPAELRLVRAKGEFFECHVCEKRRKEKRDSQIFVEGEALVGSSSDDKLFKAV